MDADTQAHLLTYDQLRHYDTEDAELSKLKASMPSPKVKRR